MLKIYKELIQSNTKTTNNPVKNGQRAWIDTSPKRTDIQMVNRHLKRCSTSNHQRDANENHSEISPHTSINQQTTSVGEDVETREYLCTVGVNADWCSHHGKQYGVASKSYRWNCLMTQHFHLWDYIQRK